MEGPKLCGFRILRTGLRGNPRNRSITARSVAERGLCDLAPDLLICPGLIQPSDDSGHVEDRQKHRHDDRSDDSPEKDDDQWFHQIGE